MRLETAVSTTITGWNRTLNALQRTRHPPRHGLGAVDRVELGNHLAGDQLRRR